MPPTTPAPLSLTLIVAATAGCPHREPAPPRGPFSDLAAQGSDAPTVARPCRSCHEAQYVIWSRSQHALAQRPLGGREDAVALATLPEGVLGVRGEVRAALGVAPLRQYLVALPGGRVQVLDPAYDPARREWFSVFGREARREGEWGHWTGRGMTWNAQCAGCHVTGLNVAWDARRDRYGTTWRAQGITCEGCHGEAGAHGRGGDALWPGGGAWRARATDTCGGCHAHREPLTGGFRPGERFDDHYRLSLPDAPGLYHPDGQAADEVFEYGSLALSAMGQRGVTCLDCHEPHGGGLRAPLTRDELCLTCHGAPSARGAPSIDPRSHTHHPEASEGARCVECHLPRSVYMQRDARRDHGFTSPDPALSRELGVPEACTRCHADRPPGWTEARALEWYGARLERRSRARARLVARARAGDDSSGSALIAAARAEPNDAWRAALVGLLGPWATSPEGRSALTAALGDPSPRVQSAAARVLGDVRQYVTGLDGLRRSPVRAVRLSAAWATREGLGADRGARGELWRWVEVTSDQPAGALRRSELLWAEGRTEEAVAWARRAAAWDRSGPALLALGRVLHAAGDADGALGALEEAERADPRGYEATHARALILGERGRLDEAERALGRVVERAPGFVRGHYNLGLARAALGRLEGALEALGRAEALAPDDVDVTWARATVLARLGRGDEARAAAARVLARAPGHEGARELAGRGANGGSGAGRGRR